MLQHRTSRGGDKEVEQERKMHDGRDLILKAEVILEGQFTVVITWTLISRRNALGKTPCLRRTCISLREDSPTIL